MIDEPAPHVFFLVGICIAGAARGGAGIKYYRCATVGLEAREDVLHPTPIGLAARKASVFREAIKFVGVVVFFFEFQPFSFDWGLRESQGRKRSQIRVAALRA